jgi:hypothetical protein
LFDRARAALEGDDAACAALGRAILDALGPAERDSCGDREPAEAAGELEADLSAFEAARAWRCGEPEAARERALRSLDASGRRATLAWVVLGELLRASYRASSASSAYGHALELDPREASALWGAANVAGERAARRALLLRYVEVAGDRGEPDERVEAARQTVTLLEALGDRDVWRLTEAELPADIDMRAIARRPGEVTSFTLKLPGLERGSLRAIVDSGASGFHVSKRGARRLGVEPLARATLHGGGGDGRHAVERGLAPRLDLGPLAFEDALVTVSPGSLHPRGAFHAILGLDVLAGMRVSLDPAGQRMTINAAEGCSDSGDPLSEEPIQPDGGWLPLLAVEGQLLVPAELTGDAGSVRLLALFDTGAAATLVDARAAARISDSVRRVESGVQAYGGTMAVTGVLPRADVVSGPVSRQLAQLPVVDLSARERLGGVRVGAMLGWDFLGSARIELDLRCGAVRMTLGDEQRRGR